jgi:hypothetical protein
VRDVVPGRDVLRALFDGCDGLVELRALPGPPRATAFFETEDINGITAFLKEQQAANQNLFWGVATRRDRLSGALGNCLHLGALFVDLDDKVAPAADVLERRRAGPFLPHIVINSGGGAHWYFLLREPLDLQQPADLALAYDALRRLAYYFGGDVPVAEPARILRVPATLNYKYTPPRTVVVGAFNRHDRFNASELRDWLPTVPEASSARATVDLSKPIGVERNNNLYRLGRGLKGKGLAAPVLVETLTYINRRCCAPPLEEWEVDQIVTHVLQQPDRPRPTADRTFAVKVV